MSSLKNCSTRPPPPKAYRLTNLAARVLLEQGNFSSRVLLRSIYSRARPTQMKKAKQYGHAQGFGGTTACLPQSAHSVLDHSLSSSSWVFKYSSSSEFFIMHMTIGYFLELPGHSSQSSWYAARQCLTVPTSHHVRVFLS